MIDTSPDASRRAASRRTDADAQQLVLQTVAREAESLLRTARRHSLCADDAHDAYQRSMEILMRRAPTLDPERVGRWLHVVVKHEAMAVRRRRSDVVSHEEVDFDRHESVHAPSPEERVIAADRNARAAEALRRLKPQELRAIWLRALGKSYAEICEETGWTYTKVNRCLAEGRKTFLERYAGIEAGDECERWQPVLSAMVDGEATAAQVTDLRLHLRNCRACRATVRGLHETRAPLAAILPVGLLGAGVKLTGLLERVAPVAAAGDVGAAGGGAGLLSVSAAKVAGLLAAGAATAAGGGGLVVAQHHRARSADAARSEASGVVDARRADAIALPIAAEGSGGTAASPPTGAERPETRAERSRRAGRRLAAGRRKDGGIEFRPAGAEAEPASPSPAGTAAVGRASLDRGPGAGDTAPAAAPTPSGPPPQPVLSAPRASADSTSGEFAPRP
ncbi:MAG TPA: sigma-70 family RNA polymerase sigma factor [Baekduia sp.]|nr:sigma-70 family RNA polymerase sigma factor [Baekduia sp.]